MSKGRVYWITGLSNSGKTTIGTVLYYSLKKEHDNVVILDGDIMKEITTENDKEKYSDIDRLSRARRYSSLGKMLSEQGMIVIICTIAMFDSVRDWNRKNIKGYVEIFLNVSENVLRERDKKGLYHPIRSDEQFPKRPDLVVQNDGDIPIRSIVDSILKLPVGNEEDFDRDKEYWNSFYSGKGKHLEEPSQFAKDISNQLEGGKHLLELGCGNGRDSLFFLQRGLRVTALDASDVAVDTLNAETQGNDKALFICDDFVTCDFLYQMKYDYIYSRFTLHAINEFQEEELFQNIKAALVNTGKVFIEARTIHDDIFGLGEQVEHNAYIYNGHYRRFIDVSEFQEKLQKLGFYIEYLKEGKGFSKTDDSDPVLMRCVAGLADV